MAFDPIRVPVYTVPELVEYIRNGEVTFEELRQLGLPHFKQDDIRAYFTLRSNSSSDDSSERNNEKEDEVWEWARRTNTVSSYTVYLSDYPSGKYAIEAEMNIRLLRREKKELKEQLFEDMKQHPWEYTFDKMRGLYNGVSLDPDQIEYLKRQEDVYSKFILKGYKIEHHELIESGVIPLELSEYNVTSGQYCPGCMKKEDYGEMPKDRTDVCFLGMPNTGQVSVLEGLIYSTWENGYGTYIPQLVKGIDVTRSFFENMINGLRRHKPPYSPATDIVLLCKIDLEMKKKKKKISLLTFAGEALRNMIGNNDLIKYNGANQCLISSNPKILFFIFDWGIINQTENRFYEPVHQVLFHEKLEIILCHNGLNQDNPEKDCTMSRVDTVVILFTKTDLMGKNLSSEERLAIANEYLMNNCRSFIRSLTDTARKFGINKENGNNPYVMTFSLGDFYVGNTVVHKPEDSENLLRFIYDRTKSSNRNLFWNF